MILDLAFSIFTTSRIIWISKYVFDNLKQLYIIFIELKLSIYLFISKIASTHRQNEDTVVTIQKELQIILLPIPLKKVSSKDQKNGQTTLITQFTPGHDRSRSRPRKKIILVAKDHRPRLA